MIEEDRGIFHNPQSRFLVIETVLYRLKVEILQTSTAV